MSISAILCWFSRISSLVTSYIGMSDRNRFNVVNSDRLVSLGEQIYIICRMSFNHIISPAIKKNNTQKLILCFLIIWKFFFLLSTFTLFGFPIFWYRAYLMKVIPETRRTHWIWYLRFYLILLTTRLLVNLFPRKYYIEYGCKWSWFSVMDNRHITFFLYGIAFSNLISVNKIPICILGINCTFYDSSIILWNCPDDVIFFYFDSDMSKSTNTVVYFDWTTVIYIYVCGKCRTQFMMPNSSRR